MIYNHHRLASCCKWMHCKSKYFIAKQIKLECICNLWISRLLRTLERDIRIKNRPLSSKLLYNTEATNSNTRRVVESMNACVGERFYNNAKKKRERETVGEREWDGFLLYLITFQRFRNLALDGWTDGRLQRRRPSKERRAEREKEWERENERDAKRESPLDWAQLQLAIVLELC